MQKTISEKGIRNNDVEIRQYRLVLKYRALSKYFLKKWGIARKKQCDLFLKGKYVYFGMFTLM